MTTREKLRRSLRITLQIARGPVRGWRWSVVRPYWLWAGVTLRQSFQQTSTTP